MPPRSSTAVVVSELFPPAVGGSAVLMGNVYSRMTSADVVVLTDASASAGPMVSNLARCRVVYRPIATRSWGVMGRGALRHHLSVAREIRALRTRGPALVHVVRALPEGLAALIAGLSTGTPYVCWCHGEEVSTSRSSRELSFLMRRVYGRAAAVIANSAHTKLLLTQLGVAADKVSVVHPGVDADRFRPDVDGRALRQRLAPDADVVLLSVGRLQRRKGHDVAIDAVARLASDLPGLRYVIVGDGAERASLEARARGLGIAQQVVFAGELPESDLPACYAACDIFAMPNRVDGHDLEGFGIVFLEAAASGKATIGGRSGGVPDAIEDGRTGRLVSGTDAIELADCIRVLAASSDLRCRFGAAGRDRVLREFTWDRAASAVADLHQQHAA